MNKLPSLAEFLAAVFLMSVCLYAGAQVGKSECQRMEVKK